MRKKKNDRLLLNLLEGEKHKHRVAMVNEEAAWNQHEPNSNMARMFVFMLLIHVVVIGGIIIYDWLNGEEAQITALVSNEASSVNASALPAPVLNAAAVKAQIPIEDCSTYEWRSGDSISIVAKKLGVTEEVLIKMNMLDKGTQLEANSIIRYPKKPVVKAVAISVAGANGELVQPVLPSASIASAESAIPLTAPGEQTFSFQSTIENELAATPGSEAVIVAPSIQDSPPPTLTKEATGLPAVAEVQKEMLLINEELPPAVSIAKQLPEAKPEPKIERREEPAVPKAIAVKRYTPPAVDKSAAKKIADTPPAKKKTAKAVSANNYTVKPNETLYSIATRHGVTVKALQAVNKISKPEALRDGMKLVIPAK